MGIACHIYAAKPNGPRGQDNNSIEFLGSAENGLWCCCYHGSRIDKAGGEDHPPEKLMLWKRLAEAKVSKLSSGYNFSYGWIDKIAVVKADNLFLNKHLPHIEMEKNILLNSPQCSGQSTFLKMISSISTDENITYLKNNDFNFDMQIKYQTVDEEVDYLVRLKEKHLSKFSNGVKQLLPPRNIEVIYSDLQYLKSSEEDIVKYIRKILNVDLSTLEIILKDLAELSDEEKLLDGQLKIIKNCKQNNIFEDFSTAEENTHSGYTIELTRKFKSGKLVAVTYEALSSTEQYRVFLDLFLAKAKLFSKSTLVLLILDMRGSQLDCDKLVKLFKIISGLNLQVIIEAPWRYEQIYKLVKNNHPIDLKSWKGFDAQKDLEDLMQELKKWSIKDMWNN